MGIIIIMTTTTPPTPPHHLVGRLIPVGVPLTTVIIIMTPLPPTTTISLTKVDSDKLESIIQRAVERSFAEAVDKAFTSTLTNPSSKGYSLVTKVFDNLLDIQKKREESSDQEYRRYAADPNLYLRQMDDDSVNASVTTPTVTR